jgi:hypothetical protein
MDSHENESWIEHLAHLGLIRTSRHLPFAKIILSFTFLAGAFTATALMAALVIHWDDRRDAAVTAGQADARDAAHFMDRQLQEIVAVASHIATFDLTEGRHDEVSIRARLRHFLESNPGFWGVGACYERSEHLESLLRSMRQQNPPYQNAELYCPYFTRPGGVVTETPVVYDYTDPDLFLPGADEPRGIWYQRPRDGGNPWNPPYFGTTSRRMVAEHVVPFYDSNITGGEDRPAGMVFVNFTLDQISESVSWLNLGGRGYGLVGAQDLDATYVAHPDSDYFADRLRLETKDPQKTFREVAGEQDSDALLKVLERRGECEDPENVSGSGFVHYRDEITGRDAWLFHEPVETTCWTLGSVVIKSEALGRDSTAHHLLMWIGISVLISLFALVALVLRVLRGDGWMSWSVLISFSVLCVLGIGYVWWLVRTAPEVEAGLGGDGQTLSERVDGYREKIRLDEEASDTVEVFAGVSLESVEESDGGNLEVSGLAWQRYVDETLADPDQRAGPPESTNGGSFEPGFVFADSFGGGAFETRFNRVNGKQRTVGWSFRTTVPGPSDVSQYPFDRGEIRLQLSPMDIDDPIILIPDLPEYGVPAPSQKPGVGDGFNLGGWDIEGSHFTYQSNLGNSGRGLPDVRAEEPQLFYTVLLARDSVDPFFSRMLPVVAVSILVFGLLLIVSHTRLRPEDFPTSTGIVSLSFLSALLFVLILGHNSLRSSLNASQIIYLEYFYFVLYVAMLFVASRVISFVYGMRVGWTHYRDTLTLDRLYWPFVSFAMLVATWSAFY